jgi:hypothetical protein
MDLGYRSLRRTTNVSDGVKLGPRRAQSRRPLCPRERTLSARSVTSEKLPDSDILTTAMRHNGSASDTARTSARECAGRNSTTNTGVPSSPTLVGVTTISSQSVSQPPMRPARWFPERSFVRASRRLRRDNLWAQNTSQLLGGRRRQAHGCSFRCHGVSGTAYRYGSQ